MTSIHIQSKSLPSTVPVARTDASRRALLVCGVGSSLLYAAMLVFIPMLWDGYSSAEQAVSELSAIDTPTRTVWVPLGIVYTVLVTAFGFGVWGAARGNRALRVVGGLLVAYGVIGLGWPPMHQREVLAAGGGTLTDTLHIVWTIVTVLLMLLAIGFSVAAFGGRFRWYSIASLVILLVFGSLPWMYATGIEANTPTPWIGVWQRICIATYLLWVVVLALVLLRRRAPVRLTTAAMDTRRSTQFSLREMLIIRRQRRVIAQNQRTS